VRERHVPSHPGLQRRLWHVVAALLVTPKTVEYHLTSIYRKVGLRSRAKLVLAFSRTGSPPA
jgi:hypothetical protein